MMLSENFHVNEFACHCGVCRYSHGKIQVDEVDFALVLLLENLRGMLGSPVTIESGRRCAKHNAAVGGKPRSQHLLGTAADIKVRGYSPKIVHLNLNDSPIKDHIGLGLYDTFVHVDTRRTKARW